LSAEQQARFVDTLLTVKANLSRFENGAARNNGRARRRA
jgi:hypothetical protein